MSENLPISIGETLGQRVLELRKELGKSQKEMAGILGVATATWQKVERDEGLPSGETLMQFEKLGINPGWVLNGIGPRKLVEESDSPIVVEQATAAQLIAAVDRITQLAASMQNATQSSSPVNIEQQNKTEPAPEAEEWKPVTDAGKVVPFLRPDREPPTIKYYNVAASAGGGRAALYEPPGEDLDVAEMVSNLLGLDIEDVFLSPIYGDSMLPTLAHDDIAVVNRRDVEMENGRVYLVSYDGQLYVKRAQWDEDGDFLWLMSDNDQSRFPPMKVAGDEFQLLRAHGRVVWVWRPV